MHRWLDRKKDQIENFLLGRVILSQRELKEQKGVFLDARQANRVLEAFREHHLQPLVYVTLYYGLRRSEAFGLKWSSIDFENNTLRIEHTVVKNLTVMEKDTTKTASGNRIYALLPEVWELLLELKEKRALFGNTVQKSDYVFTWPDGRLYHPQCITDVFKRCSGDTASRICAFTICATAQPVSCMIKAGA